MALDIQLDQDFAFAGLDTPEKAATAAAAATPATGNPLGALAALEGTWTGNGFNAIWRPHHPSNPQDRFLELNLTTETIVFTAINGPIPNRGLAMPDIQMFGLTYLQQISETSTGAGLHIEPGIWANVPPTTDPTEPQSVVRMASIPHGTVVLAQGQSQVLSGGPPAIPDNNILPFGIGGQLLPNSDFNSEAQTFTELNLSKATTFRAASPGVTQAMVENPNSVIQSALTASLQGTTMSSRTFLNVSTTHSRISAGGGTANTAFLASSSNPSGGNARAVQVDATFWIEEIAGTGGNPATQQLQYTQMVLLDFNGLSWPHVTVSTRQAIDTPIMGSSSVGVGTPEIRRAPVPDGEPGPVPGIGLCLSGGGYRAMLFHTGSLVRLNEAGYLPKLDRVSSVSGGSIIAGVLASRWNELTFTDDAIAENFGGRVVEPIRSFARKTIDRSAVAVGAFTPGVTINDRLARSYRQLFDERTLADLPDRPEFVFDATNLQSGDLWRFSKRAQGDWRVGTQETPRTQLAQVVAASSAFPPVLSPARLSFPGNGLAPGGDQDVNHPPYTIRVVLADGGVYDNLGLEAVWARYTQVLISDAGGHMGNKARPRSLWPLQLLRVLDVIDNQVRDLRKRQAVLSFIDGQRTGAYWGIRSHVRDFGLAEPIAEPSDDTVRSLAGVATRLARLDDLLQERLINWGYAICDTALRVHVDQAIAPGALPYPRSGLGPSAGPSSGRD